MIEKNLDTIKKNIADICKKTGRNPDDIKIIAATKTVASQRLKQLGGYGINICGENRVQELLEKYPLVDTEWHFIGRLQTNKVKYIIDKITLLHSLDRIKLAEEVQRQAQKKNIILNALIEINIAEEDSKGGIEPEAAEEFYKTVSKNCPNINICGLMSVMPVPKDKPDKKYYLQLRSLYDKINIVSGGRFKYLSAGMSDDYITAIACGANMIRLGRVLLGERNY